MLLDNKKPIIVVPSVLLLNQWSNELDKHIPFNLRVLKCYGKEKDYPKYLKKYSSDNKDNQIILTTIQTARTDKFKNIFNT